MEVQPRDIQRYSTPDGKVPFSEWLDSLRDIKAKFKIDRRLDRVATGNFGDYRAVGEGVYELRINRHLQKQLKPLCNAGCMT